jgi:hypothetical protein
MAVSYHIARKERDTNNVVLFYAYIFFIFL